MVAFSIGEKVGDTMIVHIEKAYAEVEGAYTMINQQFVLHEAGDCTYVNREDDTGDEGLRQAKESYHPVFMVTKKHETLGKECTAGSTLRTWRTAKSDRHD